MTRVIQRLAALASAATRRPLSEAALPVDLVIHGCPPSPAALMKGLLALMTGNVK